VEELFHQTVALHPDQRADFLDEACGSDRELRAAVEELLRHDNDGIDTEHFLVSPLVDAAEACRTTQPEGTGRGTDPFIQSNIPGYVLLAELGRGGMGVVYKARQISLNRVVALKMLLPANPPTPEQLARFRAEAEALARVQHPNIVPIYDIGESEGRPYFTMEYVAGPSLAQALDGRPQDVEASAHLIEVLARAIHAIHQQGIIHRDLKPGNILLRRDSEPRMNTDETRMKTSDGSLSVFHPCSSVARIESFEPKVTDFGLAKDLDSGTKLTVSGTAVGTPSYMAPEQVRSPSNGVGPAADIYALGAILYELLTGRPPFDAATAAGTLAQLLHDEPLSPDRLRPRLPSDLVTICMKCLEKSPRRRYASASDLAEDLRLFQAGEPIQARPVGWMGRAVRWGRRQPLAAGLGLLCAGMAVALLVTVLIYNARLQEALARAEALTEQQRQQIIQLNIHIGTEGLGRGDAISAILRFTEALRLDQGNPQTEREHRTRIATALRQCPRLRFLRTHGQHVLGTSLKGSGGRVITDGSDGLIWVRDVFTGQPIGSPVQLGELPVCTDLSPDAGSLGTIGTTGKARAWNLTSGAFCEIPSVGGSRVRRLAFDSASRHLVTQYTDSSVRVWDLTAQPPVTIWQLVGTAVADMTISDDRCWLFILDSSHVGTVREVSTGKSVAAPLDLGHAATLVTLSWDGRKVAVFGADRSLRVWERVAAGNDPASQAWQALTEKASPSVGSDSSLTQARFSPDSRLLATANVAGETMVWDTATGQAVTPPLRHLGPVTSMIFRDGGREIVTVSQQGAVRLWGLPDHPVGKGDLTPDARPVAELLALAQVLSASCIDEKQERQWLDPDTLEAKYFMVNGR